MNVKIYPVKSIPLSVVLLSQSMLSDMYMLQPHKFRWSIKKSVGQGFQNLGTEVYPQHIKVHSWKQLYTVTQYFSTYYY